HCVTHAVDPHPFLFNAPATPGIYTLSLHDALPISWQAPSFDDVRCARPDSRRDLQSELLRRLEVESEIHLARGRVRYVRNRTAPEYRLGQLARLPSDVFSARECHREQGSHLRMAAGDPEQR